MSLIIREKAKNRQNHCSYEVAAIGGEQLSKKDIFILAKLSQISIFGNRKLFLSIKNQDLLQFKVTKVFFRI